MTQITSEIGALFQEATRIASDYLESLDDRDQPVVRVLPPEELRKKLNLALPREGRPVETLTEDMRRVLHHSDFGNLNVLGTRVTGFYDLESVHIGTESMMLGKMLSAARDYRLDRDSVLEGYASAGGDPTLAEYPLRLLALEQMDPLILRTCNDGHWRGTDDDLRNSEQLGPSAVQRIREAVPRYRGRIDPDTQLDLDRWFPGVV